MADTLNIAADTDAVAKRKPARPDVEGVDAELVARSLLLNVPRPGKPAGRRTLENRIHGCIGLVLIAWRRATFTGHWRGRLDPLAWSCRARYEPRPAAGAAGRRHIGQSWVRRRQATARRESDPGPLNFEPWARTMADDVPIMGVP